MRDSDRDRIRIDEEMMANGPPGQQEGSREFSVINVGVRLGVEGGPSGYGDKQEDGRGVDHERPLDALLCGVDRIKQRMHTPEEQGDDDP